MHIMLCSCNWHTAIPSLVRTTCFAGDALDAAKPYTRQYTGAFGRVVREVAAVTFLFPEMYAPNGHSVLRPAAERGIAYAVDDFLQIFTSCDCAECMADAVYV